MKIRPLSPGDLCIMFRVPYKTFRSWLKPHRSRIGKRTSRVYTPKQVKIIFDCIGLPDEDID